MEDFAYFNELYDYYGELFTPKQREYFESYYFNNLSLGEMAEIYEVSRNAIYKQVKNVVDKLLYYEKILGMCEFNKKLISIIDKMDDSKIKEELKKMVEVNL